MKKRLIIRDDLHKLVELKWESNKTEIVFVCDLLKNRVEQVIEYGLDELLGKEHDFEKRFTLSSDPKFLPRYKDYLAKQTCMLVYELTEEV